MRKGFLAVFRKRDDGNDALLLEIAIVGVGVVMAVAAKDADVHVEAVFLCGFEESVEGLEGKSEVALVAPGHDGEEREIVAVLMDHQVVVTVTKEIGVPVGIVAPFGGR